MSFNRATKSSRRRRLARWRNDHFSLRRVLLCALPLLVLMLWIVALSSLATAGGTATADQPARMSVQVPPSAKSASVVMLEMSIAVTRKASAGHLGAVVRLRPSGGSAVEVGRVSIPGKEPELSVQRVALAMRASGGSAEIGVSAGSAAVGSLGRSAARRS